MEGTRDGNRAAFTGGLRTSRAEGLASQLEHQILDGSIAPGQRLGTKPELKERYGVAVATLNEAMRMLETRGLIEVRPGLGGGVFASSPSGRVRLANYFLSFKSNVSTAEDCLLVRNALEPLLCKDAARNARAPDIRELRKLLKKMASVSDPVEYLKWNWALHRSIAAICRNVPLQMFYIALLDFVEQDLQAVDPERLDVQDNLDVHRGLIDAIADRDDAEIQRMLDLHIPLTDRER